MKERDIQILYHILKYCSIINNDLNKISNSEDIFFENVTFQQSVSFSLLQIGELAKHFTNEFEVENQGQIPVQQIVKMRHVIVHGYRSIDLERIWYTATTKIPELTAFCKEKLNEYHALKDKHKHKDKDPDPPRFNP
jgi:uncharacterized protein with HEPN domain